MRQPVFVRCVGVECQAKFASVDNCVIGAECEMVNVATGIDGEVCSRWIVKQPEGDRVGYRELRQHQQV